VCGRGRPTKIEHIAKIQISPVVHSVFSPSKFEFLTDRTEIWYDHRHPADAVILIFSLVGNFCNSKFSLKTHFLSYKNFVLAKKVERMRLWGPYRCTKFDADPRKTRTLRAKKPCSSWAPMEGDIYAIGGKSQRTESA